MLAEAAAAVLLEVATAATMMTLLRVEVAMASGSATAAGSVRTGTRSARRGGVRVRTNINVTHARSNTVSLSVQFIPPGTPNTMYMPERAVSLLKGTYYAFSTFMTYKRCYND